jgi:hypothetical protein
MKPPIHTPTDQDLSHLLTQQTLPWIVNGSASEAQRASVAEHLLSCAACRAELEHQQQLRDALSQPQIQGPAVEQGLERLFKRLDREAQYEQSPRASSPQFSTARRRATPMTYALAACVALQAVALAALLPHWLAEDGTGFQTLSAQPPSSSAAVPLTQIRVVPDARLTLAEWNAVLSELGLQVHSGPNSAGAYALAPIDVRRNMAQTVERLRSAPGMLMVEPIGSTP